MAIPPQEVAAERALVSWPDPDNANGSDPAIDTPLSAATLRIREIEVAGFKSFRDRTVLRFPSGVTGIVGPNGCGKSNIVDAIRWVLGEQSAKRLRGEGMEDVIFGGNDRQAPLGMAQVSITFETDGLPLDQFSLLKESGHPLATVQPADIMVTRRYLRSGESEYLMNGIPCRLRDITDLFLGTGVGTKAYAIIEQGRVEQLIGAKPEELRLFIEEAAGTTLYRSRRQVAERKMERTQENLSRVRDIIHEVERQLAGLRRQAKRAEQYRTLQAEIEQLDVTLSKAQHRRLERESTDIANARTEAGERESELAAEIERLEQARRAARAREAEAQQRLQQAQALSFESRSACDECRHELVRLDVRADELATQETAAERDLAAANDERAGIAAERTATEHALAELRDSIAAAEAALTAAEADLDEATTRLADTNHDLEAAKVSLVDGLAAEAQARNATGVLQARQTDEGTRCERLQAQADALARREAAALDRAAVAEREVVERQAQLERLAGTKRERADEIRRLLEERASWDATVDAMKEGLARQRSRRDSLREIEDSHAGYGEGVRAVLAASSHEETLGLVAELLDIPADYERAVAAALGEQLQAVITHDHDVARAAVQALRRAGAGRAICIPRLPRTPPAAAGPPGGKRLLDLVRVRPGYETLVEALLANVLLVDDLETALALWESSAAPWLWVTPAGETVDPTGAIAGGNQRAEETLLAERRELRALDLDVQGRERDLATARVRQAELAENVRAHEESLREVDAELSLTTGAVVSSERDVERARQDLKDLKEQIDTVESELESARHVLGQLADESARLRSDLGESASRRHTLEEAVRSADGRVAAVQSSVVALQNAITERRVALAEQRTHRGALETMVERLHRNDGEVQRRTETLVQRRDTDRLTLEQTQRDLLAARARLSVLDEQATTRASEVTVAEADGVAAREAAESAERTIAGSQSELETVRARVAALTVQAAERRLAIEHLEQTIRDRYGKHLEGWEATALPDTAATEDELSRLRTRLAAMGDVNVAALSEVAELEERQRFLDAQQADLARALEDLRKTITRLNRASRTRFRETFTQVDATFREVFPKLFAGGKASLRLTDEDQVLDSGVEIVVQPPGKRIGPLDLLSGGEKALTAVSLIFALFLIKPSPFCFLDEVDAPLDDANIGRFNAMVREMSARSQFILITHNKRTMEVAQTLYGITMEEPGVSKVVSVRLPE